MLTINMLCSEMLSLLYAVVALCTSGGKMISQMMVQNHLRAHYRKLESVKRMQNNSCCFTSW